MGYVDSPVRDSQEQKLDVEPSDLADDLTEHFRQAAFKAVSEHHAKGISVHGDVDGKLVEVPPPKDSSESGA